MRTTKTFCPTDASASATLKTLLAVLVLACVFLSPYGRHANGQVKISGIPLISAPNGNDVLVINQWTGTGTGYTTKTIKWSDLYTALMAGVVEIVTTNTGSNSFYWASNIINIDSYLSNYFATNVLGCGNVLITTNTATNSYFFPRNMLSSAYVSNFFQTNFFDLDPYIADFFQTNGYATNEPITALYSSNVFALDPYVADQMNTNAVLAADNVVTAWLSTNTWIPSQVASNWYTTNAVPSDSYICNWLATNQWSTNVFIDNLWVTNLVAGDTYVSNFFATNAVIYNDTYVSNFFATNIYSPIIWTSNFFTTNFYAGDTYISNAYITNLNVKNLTLVQGLYYATNAWPGPTNTLPLYLPRQWYKTYTPVSVTGYTGKSNTVTSAVLLTITNAAASNVTIYLPAGTMTGNYTNQYTISNASTAKIWFEFDPGPGDTNAVFRQMR